MPIPFVPPSFMIGSIVIWPFPIATIPSNWHLCDGTNGTPDMLGLFIRGAVNDGELLDPIGQDSQSHAFTSAYHNHNLPAAPPNDVQSGTGYDSIVTSKQVTGTTDSADNRPAGRNINFIQRIS